MRFRVLGDFFQDRFQRHGGSPIPGFFGQTRIHHQPGNIEWTRLGIACDLVKSEAFRAPFAQLRERHAVFRSSAEIHDARLARFYRGHLLL